MQKVVIRIVVNSRSLIASRFKLDFAEIQSRMSAIISIRSTSGSWERKCDFLLPFRCAYIAVLPLSTSCFTLESNESFNFSQRVKRKASGSVRRPRDVFFFFSCSSCWRCPPEDECITNHVLDFDFLFHEWHSILIAFLCPDSVEKKMWLKKRLIGRQAALHTFHNHHFSSRSARNAEDERKTSEV